MKKWLIAVPAAAAAGAVLLLSRKGKPAAPKAEKPAARKPAGKKSAFYALKIPKTSFYFYFIEIKLLYPKTGVYSFASGYKDAKTVEVSLSYDADIHSFTIASEDFIAPTGDSHAAIIYAEDFAMQVEYAAYYHGENFEALSKSIEGQFKGFGKVSFNGIDGVCYLNGGNYCMAFPAADATADYVLITVVLMGDDNEEERAKLPSNPEMNAIMNTLTISAK